MLIQQDVLESLKEDLGTESFKMLLDIYFNDTDNTIEKLTNGLKNADVDALSLEAHSLKSVCATYGAEDAHEIAVMIDAKFKAHKDLAEIAEDIQNIIEVLKHTKQEMQKFY